MLLMYGVAQCPARTSLIGTTLAKLSKQLQKITYRQHTISSCLFIKMVVYYNKQLCKLNTCTSTCRASEAHFISMMTIFYVFRSLHHQHHFLKENATITITGLMSESHHRHTCQMFLRECRNRGIYKSMWIFRRTNTPWQDVLNICLYATWASESRPERVRLCVHTTEPTGPVLEPFHCDHIAKWSARSGKTGRSGTGGTRAPGCVPVPKL